MNIRLSYAFTLIELLIVIVIISILASTLIPKIKGLQDKAKYTRVEKDFQDFKAAVFMAQSNTGKPLKDITGHGCSLCECRNLDYYPPTTFIDKNLSKLPEDDVCRVIWKRSLERIAVAAGMESGALNFLITDPWGSPYLLDENENEFTNDPCRIDNFRTAGIDGYIDGYQPGTKSDGKAIYLSPNICPGGY